MGHGSYGQVYSGVDTVDGAKVAIKCIQDVFRTTEDAKRTLVRHCRAPPACSRRYAPARATLPHAGGVIFPAARDLHPAPVPPPERHLVPLGPAAAGRVAIRTHLDRAGDVRLGLAQGDEHTDEAVDF